MKTKKSSEKLLETQIELEEMKELCDILNSELKIYRMILDDKSSLINTLSKEIDKIIGVNGMLSRELTKKRQQLKDGISAVNLLIQRLSYEQALNQNYLKDLIEGNKDVELTLGKKWLESLVKKDSLN